MEKKRLSVRPIMLGLATAMGAYLVLLTLAALVNLLCVRAYNRYEYASRGERTDIGRRLRYVSKNAADFAAAKDIRIYGMATWLRETFSDLFRQDTAWSARLNRRLLLGRLVDLLVILLRDGGAYALLLVMAVRGELRPDEFVLYFSAIFYDPTQMTFSIGGFNMQQIIKLNPMYWYITGFRRTVMWGIPLDWNMFLVCGICAVVSMVVGLQMFRKTQDRFVLHI